MKLLKSGNNPFIRKYRDSYWITHRDEKEDNIRAKVKYSSKLDIRSMEYLSNNRGFGNITRGWNYRSEIINSILGEFKPEMKGIMPFWLVHAFFKGTLVSIDSEKRIAIVKINDRVYDWSF